jgi:hypothetical protein
VSTAHTVWTEDEAKAAIRKFDVIIDMANTAGANIDDAEKKLEEAVTAFGSGNLNQAFTSISETKAKLNDSVSDLGLLRSYLKFVFPIYGAWPLSTAILFFALYALLLWVWRVLYQNILSYVSLGHLGFGIPMYAALVAGIGASVQIIVDVTNDVKTNGYVEKYRRMWYMLLPIVAPVFGIIAYILLSLGFLSLSGITAQQLGRQTFSVILVCFLAGYSTEWFMRVLGNLIK